MTIYLYCKNKSSTGCVGTNTLVDGDLKDPNHNGHVGLGKQPKSIEEITIFFTISPQKILGYNLPPKKVGEIGNLKFLAGNQLYEL